MTEPRELRVVCPDCNGLGYTTNGIFETTCWTCRGYGSWPVGQQPTGQQASIRPPAPGAVEYLTRLQRELQERIARMRKDRTS